LLKGHNIAEAIYVGDDQLDAFRSKLSLKKKWLGELFWICSIPPAKNVFLDLNPGGGKLAGILKTLIRKIICTPLKTIIF